MVEMVPGTTIRAKDPTLRVDAGIAAGTYRFRLVVIDDEANVSLPSDLLVRIVAPAVVGPVVGRPGVGIATEVPISRPLGGLR